jgi:hypothetical protein
MSQFPTCTRFNWTMALHGWLASGLATASLASIAYWLAPSVYSGPVLEWARTRTGNMRSPGWTISADHGSVCLSNSARSISELENFLAWRGSAAPRYYSDFEFSFPGFSYRHTEHRITAAWRERRPVWLIRISAFLLGLAFAGFAGLFLWRYQKSRRRATSLLLLAQIPRQTQ